MYINQKKLLAEIIVSKKQDELTPAAQEMLIKIANELSRVLKYENEEDRKDCIAFAIGDLFKYWRSFNPDKVNASGQSGNAFSYYTQIAKHGLAKGWKILHGKSAHIKFININEEQGLSNI